MGDKQGRGTRDGDKELGHEGWGYMGTVESELGGTGDRMAQRDMGQGDEGCWDMGIWGQDGAGQDIGQGDMGRGCGGNGQGDVGAEWWGDKAWVTGTQGKGHN